MIWRIAIGVITILLTLALLALLEEREAKSESTCVSAEHSEAIRKLTLEGIDEAFKAHVRLLFDVWMKDHSQQPKRAQVGIANGISAYIRAQADALKWSPPVCG